MGNMSACKRVWTLLIDVAEQVVAGKAISMSDGRQFITFLYDWISKSHTCSHRPCGVPEVVADAFWDNFQQTHGYEVQPVRDYDSRLYTCATVRLRQCLACSLQCSQKFTAVALPTHECDASAWSAVGPQQELTVQAGLPGN